MKTLMKTLGNVARLGCAFPLIVAFSGAAAADYPDHPIKIIVGFPAGASTDTNTRRVAQGMSDILKQSVYVDNKPGAAGSTSHGPARSAPPDGYSLVVGTTGTLAINPYLYTKLPYDAIKDFEPVGLMAATPQVLFAPANSPVNNYKEFLAYVKARPGKVTYGSGGSTAHIAMEMLKKEAGLDLLRVPYKGAPAMITDLIGGQIDFAFEPAGSVLPLLKGGRIKFIGIASVKRYPGAPDVPTLSEQGLEGFEAIGWSVLLAPKGTPAPIVQKLNETLGQVLKDPAVIEEFARTGTYPLGGSAADARKYIQAENQRWGNAVKASGAQVD